MAGTSQISSYPSPGGRRGGVPFSYRHPTESPLSLWRDQSGNIVRGNERLPNRMYTYVSPSRDEYLRGTQFGAETSRLGALTRGYEAYQPQTQGESFQSLFDVIGRGLNYPGAPGQAYGAPAARGTPGTPSYTAPQMGRTPTYRAPQMNYMADLPSSVRGVLAQVPERGAVTQRQAYDPLQYYEDIQGAMPAADIPLLTEQLFEPQEAEINKAYDEAVRRRTDEMMARGWGRGGELGRGVSELEGGRAGEIRSAMHGAAATATEMGLNTATQRMQMALGASDAEANRALQDVLSQRGMNFDEWQTLANAAVTTADAEMRRGFEAQMADIDRQAAQQLQTQRLEYEAGMQTQRLTHEGRLEMARQAQQLLMSREAMQNAIQMAREAGYTQYEIAIVTRLLEMMARQAEMPFG